MADEDGPEVPTTRTGAEQAKAMDKVTDQVEQREMKGVDKTKIQEAMSALAEQQAAKAEAARRRDRELAAVKVAPGDIAMLKDAFELDAKTAELRLRESGGDVRAAMLSLLHA